MKKVVWLFIVILSMLFIACGGGGGGGDEDEVKTSATYFADTDGDGFGNPAVSVVLDAPQTGWILDSSDCDDSDMNEFPGQVWYADCDGDGSSTYIIQNSCDVPSSLCVDSMAPDGGWSHTPGTDCNDEVMSIYPGGAEICDGIDNDCDGLVDDADGSIVGQDTWYFDSDGDGYGDSAITSLACAQPSNYVADSTDCADGVTAVNPGASEVCDGIDNDCDGLVDDADGSTTGQSTWYYDSDNDGYGDQATTSLACAQPTNYVADSTDCADGVTAVNPGADEVCDGIDNDCDGEVDGGFCTSVDDLLGVWDLNLVDTNWGAYQDELPLYEGSHFVVHGTHFFSVGFNSDTGMGWGMNGAIAVSGSQMVLDYYDFASSLWTTSSVDFAMTNSGNTFIWSLDGFTTYDFYDLRTTSEFTLANVADASWLGPIYQIDGTSSYLELNIDASGIVATEDSTFSGTVVSVDDISGEVEIDYTSLDGDGDTETGTIYAILAPGGGGGGDGGGVEPLSVSETYYGILHVYRIVWNQSPSGESGDDHVLGLLTMGGGGGGSAPFSIDSYAALTGTSVYNLSENGGSVLVVTLGYAGLATIGGEEVMVIQTYSELMTPTEEDYYLADTSVGLLYKGWYSSNSGTDILYTPPLPILVADFVPGMTYSTSFSDTQGSSGVYSVTLNYESVSVPAGTYNDCIRVDLALDVGTFTQTGTRWFARGIGMVKLEWADNSGNYGSWELTSRTNPGIPMKTASIRLMEPGDYWAYAFTGDMSGTWTKEVQVGMVHAPLASIDCYDLQEIVDMGTPGIGSTYFLQDVNGTLRFYGDDKHWVSSSPYYWEFLQSPMAVGQSFSTNYVVGSEGATSYTYDVIGIEVVETPIGAFESYVVESSLAQNWPNSGPSNDQNEWYYEDHIIWYVPGIGEIKRTMTTEDYMDGIYDWGFTIEVEITYTNLVY